MNLLLILTSSIILVPTLIMSIQTIITNHLLMNTCSMLNLDKCKIILYRFDSFFTRYIGFKYSLGLRIRLGREYKIIAILNTIDSFIGNLLYKTFKPILAGPIGKET